MQTFRAYSFGHLKSAKSSENGRLRRDSITYHKNVNSENGRVGRRHRENAKRMNILEEREFKCCCSAEPIEAIAIKCTLVMQSPREKNLQNVIMFLKTFHS